MATPKSPQGSTGISPSNKKTEKLSLLQHDVNAVTAATSTTSIPATVAATQPAKAWYQPYSRLVWTAMFIAAGWAAASDFAYASLITDSIVKAIRGVYTGLSGQEMNADAIKIATIFAWIGSLDDALAGILLIVNIRNLIGAMLSMTKAYDRALHTIASDYTRLPESPLKTDLTVRAEQKEKLETDLRTQNAIINNPHQNAEEKADALTVKRQIEAEMAAFNALAKQREITAACNSRLKYLRDLVVSKNADIQEDTYKRIRDTTRHMDAAQANNAKALFTKLAEKGAKEVLAEITQIQTNLAENSEALAEFNEQLHAAQMLRLFDLLSKARTDDSTLEITELTTAVCKNSLEEGGSNQLKIQAVEARTAALLEIQQIVELKESMQQPYVKWGLLAALLICGVAYSYGSLAPLLGLVAIMGLGKESLGLGTPSIIGQFILYILTSAALPLNATKAIVKILFQDNDGLGLRDIFRAAMITTLLVTTIGVINRSIVFGFNGRQIEPTLDGPSESHWSSILQAVVASATCAVMTALTQQFYGVEAEAKRLIAEAEAKQIKNAALIADGREPAPEPTGCHAVGLAIVNYLKHAFITTFWFMGSAANYHWTTKILTVAISMISTLARAATMPAFFNGAAGHNDPKDFDKAATIAGLSLGPTSYVLWYKFLKGNLPGNIEYLESSIAFWTVRSWQGLRATPAALGKAFSNICCPSAIAIGPYSQIADPSSQGPVPIV